MNYVIAAWLSCAAILVVYAVRTVHRERSLRRSLAPRGLHGPGRPAVPPAVLAADRPRRPEPPLRPEGTA